MGGGGRRAGGALGDPDPKRRGVLLDEGLQAVTGLWAGEPFTFEGSLVTVKEATFRPPPKQSPRPPIWVACEWPHRRPLDRAARYDGVVPIKIVGGQYHFMRPADVSELAGEIAARRASEAGPFDIAVVPGPPPAPSPAEYEAAGATWWLAGTDGGPGWEDDLETILSHGPPEYDSPLRGSSVRRDRLIQSPPDTARQPPIRAGQRLAPHALPS